MYLLIKKTPRVWVCGAGLFVGMEIQPLQSGWGSTGKTTLFFSELEGTCAVCINSLCVNPGGVTVHHN